MARQTVPRIGTIVSPSEFYLKKVYDTLEPMIHTVYPETDWLPLMHLLRNKAAHLGPTLFRQVGLHRTADGRIFSFIPRQWPYLWEKHIKPANQQPADSRSLYIQFLRDSLIHQDVVTYSRGLLLKVEALVAAACAVLNEAYDQFKDLPENQSALLQLKRDSEDYKFESFIIV
jgi:hypothetical protein